MPTSNPLKRQSWQSLLPIVTMTTAKYHVKPALVFAIIEKESGFIASVINRTNGDKTRGGAFGLMQITFQTACHLGFYDHAEVLLIPYVNIEMGCRLLDQNFLRTKGSIPDTISMYNSGRILADAPAVTRNKYVPDVLLKLKKYEDLLNAKSNIKTDVDADDATAGRAQDDPN